MADAPLAKLTYTSVDWRTLRQSLISSIPVVTEGRWTDLNESDVGIAIVEQLVALGDQLFYYLERQVNEAMFANAVERQSVLDHSRLIGYHPRGYQTAQGTVTFRVAPSPIAVSYPVVIPAGTEVSGTTDQGVAARFYTVTDAVLASPSAGDPAVTSVGVVQGRKLTTPETFRSDGTASQRYVLRTQGVSKALLLVKVGPSESNSVAWSQVDSFLTYRVNDKVFSAEEDAQGNVFVQFGDGKFGARPPLGSNVYVYPVITVGASGNLASGTVTTVVSTILDSAARATVLTVTNPTAMSGGSDPETIEEIKRNGPALFSALYTAKTKRDFIALMQSIPGVDKANAWGEQEEEHPNSKLMNWVLLTFLALDSGGNVIDPDTLSYDADVASIQAAILSLLEERKITTTRLTIKKPEWVDVLIDVLVAVDRTRFDPALVAGDVKLAVQAALSYRNVSFGQDVRLSQVSQVVSAVPGVSWATVKLGRAFSDGSPTQEPGFVDIPVSRWQLPRVSDFDKNNVAVLPAGRAHVTVTSTTDIDAPIPDQLDPLTFIGG